MSKIQIVSRTSPFTRMARTCEIVTSGKTRREQIVFSLKLKLVEIDRQNLDRIQEGASLC